MRPLFVIEDIHSAGRASLFTIAGIRIEATRYAWLAPITWMIIGLFIAALDRHNGTLVSLVGRAAFYGAALYSSNLFHSLGHIVAGKMVHAPMDILLLTSTRDVTLYLAGPAAYPAKACIGRSLGGPIANLGVALLSFGIAVPLGAPWLQSFGTMNVALGLWTLCPIPTMDGWVIWRGLLGGRANGVQR